MKKLDKDTKFAHLGKPGTVFSKGFKRRLNIITSIVNFNNKRILDLGCGEGVWLSQFLNYTNPEKVFGTDIDVESIQMARIANPEIPESNIEVMESEKINYSNNSFDIIFQNEVLEHVKDDILTLEECLRILDDRGKLILFTPNSGWPFETHGIFLNSKYYWGNIPLLPWLPKTIQKRFAPHVRNYTNGEVNSKIKKAIISLEKITPGYQYEVIYHRHVFPGFDKLGEKLGVLGNGFKNMFRFFEKTPLHFFGISHLIVIEKLKI